MRWSGVQIPPPARLDAMSSAPGIHELKENLDSVRGRIAGAARRAGRSPESVNLVAITKNVRAELVSAAYDMGIRAVGENRVQEARAKIPELPEGLSWHMVGRLQSNKAREAAALFSLIHSVDRIRLGESLSRAAGETGRTCRGLVQVNLTGAPGQGGAPPSEVEKMIEILARLPYLQICGLMALGPYPAEEKAVRGTFRELARIYRGLASRMGPEFSVLSMGMSADYEIAIEEGSTLVRVGTAIFGKRRDL